MCRWLFPHVWMAFSFPHININPAYFLSGEQHNASLTESASSSKKMASLISRLMNRRNRGGSVSSMCSSAYSDIFCSKTYNKTSLQSWADGLSVSCTCLNHFPVAHQRVGGAHLHTCSVGFDIPHVAQNGVHRSPIVEFLLKLNSLSCHFYADKHMQQDICQLVYEWMLVEQLLTVETARCITGMIITKCA